MKIDIEGDESYSDEDFYCDDSLDNYYDYDEWYDYLEDLNERVAK